MTFLVTAGLIIDAVIIGLGSRIQPNVLKAVSPVRFITHGILIPLSFPVCGYALNFKKTVMRGVWLLTALLMAAGAAQAFNTVLEPKETAGVVRFVSGADTPKWADMISRLLSFGTVIPMMIAGAAVWIRQKTPHLFLSGFLMFAFSLGPASGNTDLIFFYQHVRRTVHGAVFVSVCKKTMTGYVFVFTRPKFGKRKISSRLTPDSLIPLSIALSFTQAPVISISLQKYHHAHLNTSVMCLPGFTNAVTIL